MRYLSDVFELIFSLYPLARLNELINLEMSPPQDCFPLAPAEGISSPLVRPNPLEIEGVVGRPAAAVALGPITSSLPSNSLAWALTPTTDRVHLKKEVVKANSASSVLTCPLLPF